MGKQPNEGAVSGPPSPAGGALPSSPGDAAKHVFVGSDGGQLGQPKSPPPPPSEGAGNLQQPRKFAATRWSLVRAAGAKPTPQSRAALEALCHLYWYPLYAFARRAGRSAEDGHDLTQAFFSRLIEKNDLAAADPARGHFRSWLLACFKHFLANEKERERAQKRGGGVQPVELSAEDADGRYRIEPSHDLTPEKLFERRWTLTLLERVLAMLRDEYTANGSLPVFEALKGGLVWDKHLPHADVGAALRMKPNAVRQAALRLRRRYGELFHAEVADTVERPEDVDDEVRRLLSEL